MVRVIMEKKKICLIAVTLFACTLKSGINNRDETDKIISLIDYAKGGANYNRVNYPAGYNTLFLDGVAIPGLRDPIKRLSIVPYDFSGKTVLDIGSNNGGMLFALADKIKHGVGIDFNHKLINVANKIKSFTTKGNLDFYTFDLDEDNIDTIKHFLPYSKVDICFFLAMCAWVKQWRRVIDFAASVAPTLLFESNGKNQDQQIRYLKKRYANVIFLDAQRQRKVFLCYNK
jgi:SAM-dependent methyltransferase